MGDDISNDGSSRRRGTRFSDAKDETNRERSREREPRTNCRVYISNIPYDFRWQDLKDLFRRVVGSVEYVELFNDENGKARGCGIVEFKDPDNVEKAMEKMNRYEINGRELVVKEDHGENRDQYGRIVRDNAGGRAGGRSDDRDRDRGRDDRFSRRDDDRSSRRDNVGMLDNFGNGNMSYNTYGLSAGFLESLGINGPLHNKIFVANLDYKVDSKKLKQVFKLAGKVQSIDLSLDKDGNSRGFAVIEYDHPVEAVQAISMLDRQMLFERRMTVRLDRIPDKGEGLKLPEGLGGIGVGLGPGGEPLKDVAHNLPNQNQNLNQGPNQNSLLQQSTIQSLQQPIAQQLLQQNYNPQSQLSQLVAPSVNVAAAATGNLLSNNGQSGLDLNNLNTLRAALSNPLLSNNLQSLGLNLGGAASSNLTSSMQSSNDQSLTNNYSTGNSYSSGYGAGASAGNNDYSNQTNSTSSSQMYDSLRQQYSESDYNSSYGTSGRKSDTIIIKNIPLTCTWQTLRDKFRDIGEVKFAEIRGNDIGVVRFFKEKDAEVAIKLMDGSRMEGRTVSVAFF